MAPLSEQGVRVAVFLGKSEPPLELRRWVEGQILQANHDDVTQTDFVDATDHHLTRSWSRARVIACLLTALVSERQFMVGALTSASSTMRATSSGSRRSPRSHSGSTAI